MIKRLAPAMALAIAFTAVSSVQAQAPGLVEFSLAGKRKQGLALAELSSEVVILGRDGWLHSMDPRSGRNKILHIDGKYKPISATELRNELRREFAADFEVVATNNFLVVQPKGRGNRWPTMFEQSHRGFVSYMNKRGITVRKGRFPMVAIVYPDESAMYREFRRQKIDVSRVAGLYSNSSNRVMTHDGGHIQTIAATVRHEAAHQSAFNSGVHSRVADTPKWITEGIGQMFEPAAMTNSRLGTGVRDRMNRESINYILNRYPARSDERFSQDVVSLLGDDEMFNDPKTVGRAYAIAWAMMFYLAERQPQAFAGILKHTSRRASFALYKRADRIKDMQRITGLDAYDLGNKVNWYVHSLK